MRKIVVIIGVVVLLLGIGLFAGGAFGALGSITVDRTFTQSQNGEYVSAEIALNKTSDIVVSSPASVGGIIHAQDLSLVTSANFNSYAIPYNSTSAGSDIYKSVSGDFYYIAFTSTQPSTTIVATPVRSSALGFGVLVLLGIVCVVAGIVIAVVGAILKSKAPIQQQP